MIAFLSFFLAGCVTQVILGLFGPILLFLPIILPFMLFIKLGLIKVPDCYRNRDGIPFWDDPRNYPRKLTTASADPLPAPVLRSNIDPKPSPGYLYSSCSYSPEQAALDLEVQRTLLEQLQYKVE